ncbi:MAG: tetratricopeptide repeat protein [Thermoplasmata archaeon]
MKDLDQSPIGTAINPERMERILERDKQEIEVERQIEELGKDAFSPENKKERMEKVRRISRKYYEIANGMVEDALYSEAIELYSKSIAILRKTGNRRAVDSYFNRAITLAMMGYPKMALDDLKIISRAKPPKADVYFVKGQIFESLGREKLAERMYRKSLEIDPNFYRAARSLANIHLR